MLLHKYLLTLGIRGFFGCGGRPTHLRQKAEVTSGEGTCTVAKEATAFELATVVRLAVEIIKVQDL